MLDLLKGPFFEKQKLFQAPVITNKISQKTEEPKKKRVRKNVWKHTVETTDTDFVCEGINFDTKVAATKHFIDNHMEAEKFEACQFCVEVFASGDRCEYSAKS